MTNPIADPLVEVPDTETESEHVILTATPEGVATVTINRAVKRNAFNAEVISALSQVFETLQAADGVRLVLLTGAGQAFSAGADLEWMKAAVEWSEADNREDAMGLATMLRRLHDLPQMTVALVNGAAMGGGAGLVAACDHAVAVEGAQFSFSEVKLGLTPATISPYVVAAIGPRRARALFASGRVFDAAYAEKIGLVDEVVADAEGLKAAADRIAGEIKLAAPGAIADAKALVDFVADAPIDHALMEETAKRIAKRRVSPEGQAGVRAFLDRKKPDWAQ